MAGSCEHHNKLLCFVTGWEFIAHQLTIEINLYNLVSISMGKERGLQVQYHHGWVGSIPESCFGGPGLNVSCLT
jgi:hypothetical protein